MTEQENVLTQASQITCTDIGIGLSNISLFLENRISVYENIPIFDVITHGIAHVQ